jgi:hypothetical protein
VGTANSHIDEIRYGPELAQQLQLLDRVGVELTADQQRPLASRARKKLVAGGERAGKSFYTAAELVTRVLWGRLFWIVGPDYELARPELEYVAEWLGQLGAIANPRYDISLPKYGKAFVKTKTGQLFETKTADDVRKIAARAPDGIVLVEAAQLSYDVYLKVNGRLSERRGWLVASGTFEGGAGWYPELFDEWQGLNPEGGQSFSLPSWGNTKIFPGGRDDPEILRLEAAYSKVPLMFEERCGAVPAPPANLVFSQFRESVHVDSRAVFQDGLPVYLAVDPSGGTNPYAVGVYQFHDPGYVDDEVDIKQFAYLIDRFYERGATDEEAIEECQTRPWWKNVAGGAVDVMAPDSRKRWLKIGGVNLWSKKVEQIEGIRRLQSFLYFKKAEDGSFLEPPHLLVNPDVSEFAYEVRHYKRPRVGAGRGVITAQGLEKIPPDVPPANQPNHLLKATWYLLIGRFGYVKSATKRKPIHSWKRRRMQYPLKASEPS